MKHDRINMDKTDVSYVHKGGVGSVVYMGNR